MPSLKEILFTEEVENNDKLWINIFGFIALYDKTEDEALKKEIKSKVVDIVKSNKDKLGKNYTDLIDTIKYLNKGENVVSKEWSMVAKRMLKNPKIMPTEKLTKVMTDFSNDTYNLEVLGSHFSKMITSSEFNVYANQV